jgi:hypothetical protein
VLLVATTYFGWASVVIRENVWVNVGEFASCSDGYDLIGSYIEITKKALLFKKSSATLERTGRE